MPEKLKANKDNVFVEAVVEYDDEDYYVHKVNPKTLYVSKDKEHLKQFKNRINRQLTWKSFCDVNNILNIKYDKVLISKEEADRKEEVEAIQEAKKNQKNLFKANIKRQIQKIWRQIEAKEKGKKYKSIRHLNNIDKNQLVIIEYNLEKKMVLVRLNDDYLFYGLNEEVYLPFIKKTHKKGKEIFWPESLI